MSLSQAFLQLNLKNKKVPSETSKGVNDISATRMLLKTILMVKDKRDFVEYIEDERINIMNCLLRLLEYKTLTENESRFWMFVKVNYGKSKS